MTPSRASASRAPWSSAPGRGGFCQFTLTHPGGPGPEHRFRNLGRHLGSGETQKNKRRPTIKRTFFQNTRITALASTAFSRMRTLATFFFTFNIWNTLKGSSDFFFLPSYLHLTSLPAALDIYRVAQVRDVPPHTHTDESVIL